MTEVVRFKISSTVAAFVKPGTSAEKKLDGIRAASSLEPFEQVTLLFCLLRDADPVVKQAAEPVFSSLPEGAALSYIQSSDAHPTVLSELAKAHHGNAAIVQALLGAQLLSPQAREFLQRHQKPAAVVVEEVPASEQEPEQHDVPDSEEVSSAADDDLSGSGEDEDEAVVVIDESGEEFLSKYKIAMIMGIGEKIKMALTGDKEWRAILIKDTNKLVSGSVIKNPRITDGEILTLLKVGVQNDEIVRLICANREWIKNYNIRKALVCCPKTPLPNALRYLATLTEKDIAGFAKSKNISSVVSTQAKRILLSKKR